MQSSRKVKIYDQVNLNLVNMIFGKHDFFPEPKVALTKELVYLHYVLS